MASISVKFLNGTDINTILTWFDYSFKKRNKIGMQDSRTLHKLLGLQATLEETLEQDEDFQRDWTE